MGSLTLFMSGSRKNKSHSLTIAPSDIQKLTQAVILTVFMHCTCQEVQRVPMVCVCACCLMSMIIIKVIKLLTKLWHHQLFGFKRKWIYGVKMKAIHGWNMQLALLSKKETCSMISVDSDFWRCLVIAVYWVQITHRWWWYNYEEIDNITKWPTKAKPQRDPSWLGSLVAFGSWFSVWLCEWSVLG